MNEITIRLTDNEYRDYAKKLNPGAVKLFLLLPMCRSLILMLEKNYYDIGWTRPQELSQLQICYFPETW